MRRVVHRLDEGGGMTDVLQCPYCDLRFTSSSELEQHKAFDHPEKDEEPAEES